MLQAANRIQVPSHISFSTALSAYQLTSQVYRTLESAALKRSIRYDVDGQSFQYLRLNESQFGGFQRQNGLFIATPEKALADIIYLCSMGKYAFDFNALNREPLEMDIVLEFLPEKSKKWWLNHG